ncbi:rab effector Noc2 [Caerostris extrusa]|uniref:Rab effector Noc2 n=1 Tax=Caerostris extrusa TaxID=172846 RepID=A0AAV4X1X7_CAEEX|nr:rab effector Noc2 [Caerostris extrusa]
MKLFQLGVIVPDSPAPDVTLAAGHLQKIAFPLHALLSCSGQVVAAIDEQGGRQFFVPAEGRHHGGLRGGRPRQVGLPQRQGAIAQGQVEDGVVREDEFHQLLQQARAAERRGAGDHHVRHQEGREPGQNRAGTCRASGGTTGEHEETCDGKREQPVRPVRGGVRHSERIPPVLLRLQKGCLQETWKKSGAWFYKGLPKYILPVRHHEPSKYSTTASPSKSGEQTQSPQRSYNSWLQSKGKNTSEKENTDSSDDELKSSRLAKRATVKKSYGESVENHDYGGAMTPPTDFTQGPSPTHLYSPNIPDSPRSPQQRDDFNRSPQHEGYLPYAKQEKRVAEGERSQTPTATASHWYKPSTRRDEPEDYPDRQYRGHSRKDPQDSPVRYRPPSSNSRAEEFSPKKAPSPEETSKKHRRFYKKRKHRKPT